MIFFAGNSSLLLEVCKIKSDNPNLSPKEISNIAKISPSATNKYLRFGNEHNLCKYDSREEHLKSNRNNSKKNAEKTSKALICLDNGKTFNSVMDCDNTSLEVFGIKLDYRNISAVCNGKRKTTGGYSFKFIKDLTSEELIKYNLKKEGN